MQLWHYAISFNVFCFVILKFSPFAEDIDYMLEFNSNSSNERSSFMHELGQGGQVSPLGVELVHQQQRESTILSLGHL